MPDRQTDPFDALRTPIIPLAPDPAFAADLRRRLTRPLPPGTRKEPPMSSSMTTRARNGFRHGDVSYITLGVPDLARAQAFYGAALGWRFTPGRSEHGAQVEEVVPMIGVTDAPDSVRGTVLAYRVDDIGAAVAAVRAHGGTIGDAHREPYAMAAEGVDNQGIPFYLHELPPVPADAIPGGEFHNGNQHGDVSYLTMVVPDIDAARRFYGGVFGWTFNVGQAGGAQVSGVAPQIGMTTRPERGPADPGVLLCYRVDDMTAAVRGVEDAGGQPGEVRQRPYGLESLCVDDQGTPFYLHQF
jgi:predicted enzyme related to lactoylglutathione lyase